MYCKHCKATVEDGASFCPCCGRKVKRGKKKTVKKTSRKKNCIIIWLIAALFCFAMGVVAAWLVTKRLSIKNAVSENSITFIGDETNDDLMLIERDADTYFNERGDILDVISAAESETVHTEKEVHDTFIDRGFGDSAITSVYTADGKYDPTEEITEKSDEKHPMYQTYYLTESGEVWFILEINGALMANPVSYNLQSSRGVQLIISERTSVMSYDPATDQFYETIPDTSVMIVKTVERIDAETLESLTIEVIDQL